MYEDVFILKRFFFKLNVCSTVGASSKPVLFYLTALTCTIINPTSMLISIILPATHSDIIIKHVT